jgi:MFS transporter, PPP family, 3-phenylpropionic acid transporter
VSIPLCLRGFNFFYFSLFSLFLSFLPVYGAKAGFSATHLGFILGLGSLISIFSQPLWGMVSDRYRTIRKLLLLLIAASVIVGAGVYRSEQLWAFTLLVALMNVFFLPTDPLVESLNFQTAQRQGISYGSVRMFGALGYAVASLAAGLITGHWGMSSLSWIFLGVGIVTLLLAFGMADVQASAKRPAFHELKAFISQSHSLLFFLLVLVVAVAHKMNDQYIGLYMDRLGGGMRLTGLAWFVMTLTETVFFALSARMIKPGREVWFMTAAAAMYALRFLLSSWVNDPFTLVALQMFQGVTFVFFYVGGIQYLHTIVPEQWKSTGQTVLSVVFFGVSGIIGSTLGGWIIGEFGGAVLYRIMALFAGAGFLLFWLLFLPRLRRAALPEGF